MTLRCYPVPGKAKSEMLCRAFAASAPASAEGAVFAGVKLGNVEDWRRVRSSGEPWYYIDNSYFDQTRATHFRVTRNKLQLSIGDRWDANPLLSERFRELRAEIKPWRPVDRKLPVLIVPQSDDHMVHTLGFGNAEAWILWAKARAEADYGAYRVRSWSANKLQQASTFLWDLDRCQRVMTHTSMAAVTAILAGVEVDCDPQCCAYGMNGFGYLAREIWACHLADNQFTLGEIKKGMAWRTLHP